MKKSFFRKYAESVLAILAVYVLLVFLLIMVLNIPGMKQLFPDGFSFPELGIPTEIFLVFFPFIGGLLLAIDWGFWERAGVANPESWHGIFRDIVAAGLACVVLLFAFFYYQLPYSQGLLTKADTLAGDLRIGELVGLLLYKNALMRACLVASLFVAGGVLLFRPTRRLGAILTGVFFLVIALIQGFFSQLNEVNVFVLVFGLILIPAFYFISLPGKEHFTKEQLSARSVLHFFRSPGNMLRLGLLAFMAWLFIGYFRMEKKPSVLYGKWKVLHLNRNGGATNLDLWKTDSLAWNRVYIEGAHFITMSPNPYQHEHRRAIVRSYTYDSSRHIIIFREAWSRHPDTIQVSLSGPGQMQWVGKWGADSLRMELQLEQQGKGL